MAPLPVEENISKLKSEYQHGSDFGPMKHGLLVTVLDHNHVATIGTSTGDDTIELQSPVVAIGQLDPLRHGIVASRYDNDTSSLASIESTVEGSTNVRFSISDSTILGYVASLYGSLGRM